MRPPATQLVLLVQAADQRFAVPAIDVNSVLPSVAITPVPGAPHGVAGLFSNGGDPVPVVDLAQLIGKPEEPDSLGRRLLLIDTEGGSLALLVSRVLGTRRLPVDERTPAAQVAGAPWAGRGVELDGELVVVVRPLALLTPQVRAALGLAARP